MALYNNGFPTTYQYYPQYQPVQQSQPAQQTQNTGIIWVQGEAGAKSYLVAPNTTVQLWDSEKQTIYLKSADASGMPSMKTLDYTIREAAQTASAPGITNPSTYATKAEIEAINAQIEAIKAQIEESNAKRAKRRLTEDE